MRLVCLLMIVLSAAVAPEPTQTQTEEPKTVTLSLGVVTVREALDALFRGTGFIYKVGDNAAPCTIHPIALNEVPFETALRALCKHAGLTYSSDKGVRCVNLQTETAQKPTEPKEADQPASPPRLFGMNRYQLRHAIGEPDVVRYYQTPGREDWHYGDHVVELANCRVEFVRRNEVTFAVGAGCRQGGEGNARLHCRRMR